MFIEEDYRNPDEPEGVSASENGCIWAGCLHQRKSGGFDLFYDHGSSDFKPLNVEAITKLRRLCELTVASSLSLIWIPRSSIGN